MARRSYLGLGLHLKADAQLVSRLVQLCAVKVGGESHGAAIPELLLVAQTNLENEGFH